MQLLAIALGAAVGLQGSFTIANGGFEDGPDLWGRSPASTVAFESRIGPRGEASTVARFPAGRPQAVWRTLPVGSPGTGEELWSPPSPQHLGPKVEFGVWFRPVGGGFRAGDAVRLRIKSGTEVVAEGVVDPSTVPAGVWHFLHTEADPGRGLDGCVRFGTVGLTAVIEADAGGEVWFDDLVGKPFDYDRWPLEAADFEAQGAVPGAWKVLGDAGVDTAVPALHGRRCAVLRGSDATLLQVVSAQHPGAQAQEGVRPEAGTWVWVQPGPVAPDDGLGIEVWHVERVPGRPPRTTRLAYAHRLLGDLPRGRWIYLETDAATCLPIPSRSSDAAVGSVVVALGKRGDRIVRFDYAQLGERHAVDGNPARLVFTNYLARFRNPAFAPDPLVDVETNDLEKRWRGWYWGAPPAAPAGGFSYVHDPETTRGGTDGHEAGRRDLAVGGWEGPVLPLLGAYDSRDPVVVDFHVRLIRAAGFDAVMFGWYGQKAVELDECAPRKDSVNGPALETLYQVIEANRSDLKVAVKLNLQRHLNDAFSKAPPGCNFVPEPTLEAKRAGIRDDLVWLVETYGDRRPTLKHDGRMVVSVFDPAREFVLADGSPVRFSEMDWALVHDEVEARTGREILLIFDTAPPLTVPLSEAGAWYDGVAEGCATWMLAPCSLTLFDRFSDYLAGRVKSVSETAVRDHFRRQILGRPYRWWRADDARRIGIALAYAGFDDSGVAGWGKENGECVPGEPRCVRVVPARGLEGHVCPGSGHACLLEVAFDEALRSGLPWIQVPTWNDWNELTALEPAYSRWYVESLLDPGAYGPGDHDREWVLGRLLQAQASIARFHGEQADPEALEAIVQGFVLSHLGPPYP